MNKDITLVILAAGMGSRYGGLKQIDKFGLSGEAIIEFSIHDAIKAGFNKLVLIIREEHKDIFEEELVGKLRPFIEVEYAFQSLEDVKENVVIDKERVKPLGTTHALLSAKNHVNTPFAIINADDFYGYETYKGMADFLKSEVTDTKAGMMGFILDNTLTDHGTVTRGVCADRDGFLVDIVETEGIQRVDGRVVNAAGETIADGTLVSMNFWGFTPHIFDLMGDKFDDFTRTILKENPLKGEALLPQDVGALVKEDKLQVEILESPEKWIGVTYQEDKPLVIDRITGLQKNGTYPEKLWEK